MPTAVRKAKKPSRSTNGKAYETFPDEMLIGGSWRRGRGDRVIEDVDPYRGETLLNITSASAEDVDDAYRKAAEAQRDWAAAPPQFRRDVLLRAAEILSHRKDSIVDWLIRETGATRVKAEVELQLVREGTLEASTYPFRVTGRILPCSIPGKESRVYRRPVGVVGVISPWDFSLQLTNRSVAPALACGNAVVLKPASLTPVTGGLLFAKIYEEAGLPPGVLSVVVGDASEIGDALVAHPVPRLITFTGSTAVGRHIGELAGKHLKRTALELGGNGPLIVLGDADLDQAVDIAVFGKFLNSGQICMAINRIIVDRNLHDDFLKRFAERAAALKCGDPFAPETDLGPMITEKQFKRTRELADQTLKAGARVVYDGRSEGLVMHPVVLADVTNDMPGAQNELFGPVALVLKADGEEEAVRLANDVDAGLSSSVITGDLDRGASVAQRIQAGMTHVNDIPINDEANSPFGGEKASGYGRFGGVWALEEFTTEHWVTIQRTRREYPF